ncbi:MAG: hypothetical protein CSYNP_00884 [Syntrophus sp. SKADARSKE-3]|nr:hypothetical protein [Syntrophus sp. SKADARSKE-3]
MGDPVGNEDVITTEIFVSKQRIIVTEEEKR